jgi:hypothetical protein
LRRGGRINPMFFPTLGRRTKPAGYGAWILAK